jgi:Polysaccharide lyase family 4, domain II
MAMDRTIALGLLGSLVCAPLASAQGGSVTGTITTAAKGTALVRVTIDQKVCGNELPDESIVVDANGRLANAVVILTGVKRQAPADTTVMNEKCRFAPRVQLARPNANVRTTSKDAVLHTTQAQVESGRPIFNVALPVPGLNITKPLGGAGVVRLSCNTHPWMRGWMIVTDDAAAITGVDGRFTIDKVPPGTYELRVWHEALKGAPQRVTVAAGKPTEASLQLK